MIIKKVSSNINESLGITNERAKEIGDILMEYFDKAVNGGVFDGAKVIDEIEKSGKIKTQEEMLLVFWRIGIYLGGQFEIEAELRRKQEAMKQLGSIMNTVIKPKPTKRIIN